MMYWQTYRAWLLKLLSERIYLSSKGFRPDLKEPARKLKNLIEYNGYRNDKTLAGLLIRKKEVIEPMIPKNKAYENQITILNEAISKGQKLAFS